MDEAKTLSSLSRNRAIEHRAPPHALAALCMLTMCRARSRREVGGMGRQRPPPWALAQWTTVAMGCSEAQCNSGIFQFPLELFKYNPNSIQFELKS
jgi:hypothetical protein